MKIFSAIILPNIILMFLSGFVSAQLLEENFDYTAGTTLTANGWTAHSGAGSNPITVTSPGLTYSGYASSGIGNAALLDNTGEDVNRNFTEQTSGIIYASFLVNITAMPTSGSYFLHLGPTNLGTNFKGRVFAQNDGSGNLNFGLSKGSTTGTFSSTDFSFGTTYLVVLKYEFVTGTNTDDKVSLFVFTEPTLPGAEPGTPEIGPLTDATTDAPNLGSVALRQFSSSQDLVIDGIRIGISWSDAPLPVSLSSFTATAGNRKVTLRWVTESEQENVGFKILRATEKSGNYQQLSSYENNDDLKGQFNTNTKTKYQFVDKTVVNGTTYWYKLVDVDVNGVHTEHPPVSATPHAAGNEVTTLSATPPGSFVLHPNYPNPFNPSTTLRFEIPALSTGNTQVEMVIYNVQGQKVKTLYQGNLTPGTHQLIWDGDTESGELVSSGTYYAVLRMENLVRTTKLLFIK